MENKEQVKIGDVVYLKSGGQPLTISAISNEEANCYWMNGNEIKYYRVPVAVLTKVKPKN